MESSEYSAEFVDQHRSQLIQRVTMVMPIAEDLLSQGMIHKEVYSNISAPRTDEDKMRELFKGLDSGGNKVKSAFLSMLRENEPNLVQDLGQMINYQLSHNEKEWHQLYFERGVGIDIDTTDPGPQLEDRNDP